MVDSPPNGLGLPWEAAEDYLNSITPNCGTPVSPDDSQNGSENGVLNGNDSEATDFNSLNQQYPLIPDNFYGFLLLLGGLR